MFAMYGFQKGFGTTLWNSVVQGGFLACKNDRSEFYEQLRQELEKIAIL